jgi:hypothetical protein
VKGLRRLPAMRLRVRERPDHLDELEHRPRPAVCDEHRLRARDG